MLTDEERYESMRRGAELATEEGRRAYYRRGKRVIVITLAATFAVTAAWWYAASVLFTRDTTGAARTAPSVAPRQIDAPDQPRTPYVPPVSEGDALLEAHEP